jgi:hypothetical protein
VGFFVCHVISSFTVKDFNLLHKKKSLAMKSKYRQTVTSKVYYWHCPSYYLIWTTTLLPTGSFCWHTSGPGHAVHIKTRNIIHPLHS